MAMQDTDNRTARRRVLGVTSLAAFMVAFDALIVTTALATIRHDFAASLETLQWITNAYNLSFAVLLLTGAALGDRFGRRRMFVAGIVLFVLASIGCALAGSIGALIVARIGQGAGAALVVPIAMTLLSAALGYGALGSGLGLLPWTATLFVTAPIAGSLVNRIGERPIVVIGLLMQAAGMAWIATIATPGVAYAELVVPLIVAGVGVSMAMPAVQNAILNSVAVVEMGSASGIFNMVRFLGGMFGVALLVAMVSASASPASDVGTGFAAAMSAAAALSLCGAIAGLWLPARREASQALAGEARTR
jgi:MFS family permease